MILAITAGLCAIIKVLGALEWAPLYRGFMFIPAQLLSFFFLRDYHESDGIYRFPGFIIDYSCSGIHFFIIAALLAAYSARRSLGGFTSVLASAYLVTLVANTVRIGLFLKIEHYAHGRPWLHEAVGTMVFVCFLLIYYFIFTSRRQHGTQG